MTLRTVEAIGTVAPDGTLTARLPPDVPPGEHRVVVVLEQSAADVRRSAAWLQETSNQRGLFGIRVRDVGPWPEGLSLPREDMYGDPFQEAGLLALKEVIKKW